MGTRRPSKRRRKGTSQSKSLFSEPGLLARLRDAENLIVVGVDPGRVSGYGVVVASATPGKVYPVFWGAVDGRDGHLIGEAVDKCRHAAYLRAGPEPIQLMVTEDQFVQGMRANEDEKRQRGKQLNALRTATSKGRWLGLGEFHGFHTLSVQPAAWRERMLGRGWGRRRRAQVKAQALDVVYGTMNIPLKKTHDHVAEALLIAVFAAKELQLARIAGEQMSLA